MNSQEINVKLENIAPYAVGFSTPDLIKGDKGEKGDRGEKGEKGDTGNSGVYVGSTEPTDEKINVWVDTAGGVDITYAEGSVF